MQFTVLIMKLHFWYMARTDKALLPAYIFNSFENIFAFCVGSVAASSAMLNELFHFDRMRAILSNIHVVNSILYGWTKILS